jgi:hypothetical protein
MIPRSLVWAREQSLPGRVFAMCVSCRRMILLISNVLRPSRFLVAAVEGWTLTSAVAMSDAVFLRALPAWPMGM